MRIKYYGIAYGYCSVDGDATDGAAQWADPGAVAA
jgi:hypothetical protein